MIKYRDIIDSIEYVAKNSDYVVINEQEIEHFVRCFILTESVHWSKIYPFGYHSDRSSEDELDFIFLIGSQAFCFWGYPDKWTIQYKNTSLDGWWALIACFEKAFEKNIPILEGEYLASLTLHDARSIFEGYPEIPLLKERVKILNDIGNKLTVKYNGRFHTMLNQTLDAFFLIDTLKEFYGFNDSFMYKGRKIYFYKKAQVVISDIYELLRNTQYGTIKNYELLPGHADYKIPAMMRSLGILYYRTELSQKVDKREYLEAGSPWEIEIRANMLWATHLICQKMSEKNISLSPVTVNGILWNESQKKSNLKYPYHLTETMYY